jgi:vitamin B12 transporter
MKNFAMPKGIWPHACWIVGLSAVGVTHGQAQELNPIVVVSNRVNEQLVDALPSVSVLQKSDIEKFRYADLYELLSGQAGLQVTRSGGAGNPTSAYMR